MCECGSRKSGMNILPHLHSTTTTMKHVAAKAAKEFWKIKPFSNKLTASVVMTGTLITFISALSMVSAYKDPDFNVRTVPWGEKCKLPKPGEPLLPEEECDQTKGILCQKYQQGYLCGCQIGSALSYDKVSKECRRRPGSYCTYVNVTDDPSRYETLKRHMKCHKNAECVRRIERTSTGNIAFSKQTYKEIDTCECKAGYIRSNDFLECVNINSSTKVQASGTLGILCLMGFLMTLVNLSWS